jgi:hypothetical protein
MLQWIKAVVTRTDVASVRQRNQMKLPKVPASQVRLITDNKVCIRLVAPYNARTVMQDSSGSVAPSGKLYVIKVGRVYVANDPVKDAGDFVVYVTLDSKFKVIASSLG